MNNKKIVERIEDAMKHLQNKWIGAPSIETCLDELKDLVDDLKGEKRIKQSPKWEEDIYHNVPTVSDILRRKKSRRKR